MHLHYVSGMEETAYLGPNLTIRDGKYLTKHVYVGDQRVSSKMDPEWFQYPPTLYFHPDHLGSTQYASNDEQTLIQHDEFFPSGEPWRDETDSRYELARRFVFTGKELDVHTGLYDYGARSYDARMGVWLSPDPILDRYMLGRPSLGVFNPMNMHVYGYAANAPTVYIDESGEFFVLPLVVGGVVGGALGSVAAAADPNATAGSIMAGFLGGAATGAIGAVPVALGASFFASGAVMSGATSAVWGAAVAGPVGFSVAAVADRHSATINALYGSIAAGALGGVLSGAPSRLATRATFFSAGGRTIARDGVESAMSAPKADLARTMERAGAASMGAEGAVGAGVQQGVQAGMNANDLLSGQSEAPTPSEPAAPSGPTPRPSSGPASATPKRPRHNPDFLRYIPEDQLGQ